MDVRVEVAKTKINENGRIVIPARLRAAMGWKPGDEVMLRVQDGELRVYTFAQALSQIQRELKHYVKPGVSLVDEFIAERRAEAARDHPEAAARHQGRSRASAHRAR